MAYKLNNSLLVGMVQSQLASIFMQLKEYEKAKKYLQISMRTKNKFDQSAVYSIASKLYHRTGRNDSAIYYYKKLLDCGTIYSKKNAYWGLGEISINKRHLQDAYLYLKQYMIYQDSVSKITDAETLRKMNSLYNYQLRENESKRLKTENDKKTLMIIAFFIFTVFLIIAAIIYVLYSRVKKLQLSMRLKEVERLRREQYRKSLQFINENNRKMEELENKLRDANNTNETLRIQLKQQQEEIIYANKQALIAMDENAIKKSQFRDSEIGMLLNDRLTKKQYKLSTNEWEALEKEINEVYDDFTVKLNSIYRMSDVERHVCLLIKMNLTPSQIAEFTQRNRSSISLVRARLYNKFFGKKGECESECELWDEFIRSL